MPSVRIGASYGSLTVAGGGTETDDSGRVRREESGDFVEREFNIDKASFKAASDLLVIGTADTEFPNSKLRRVVFDPKAGTAGAATLFFEPQSLSFAVGTVIKEIDANAIEAPIRRNIIANDAEQDAAIAKGQEAFLSPQPVYRRTEIISSFTFNEANAIDDVAKIDNTPEGLISPSAGKWLKVANVVRSTGDNFEKVEVWQFAQEGVNPDLYVTIA